MELANKATRKTAHKKSFLAVLCGTGCAIFKAGNGPAKRASSFTTPKAMPQPLKTFSCARVSKAILDITEHNLNQIHVLELKRQTKCKISPCFTAGQK
jgi:hypothetical protein